MEIVPTELYDVTTGISKVLTVLSHFMTPRFGHSLIRLEHIVYVLGGKDDDGTAVAAIDRFDTTTEAWTKHSEALLTSTTMGRPLAIDHPVVG